MTGQTSHRGGEVGGMWDYGNTTGAILGGAKAKSVRGSKNSIHIIIEATFPMSYEQ